MRPRWHASIKGTALRTESFGASGRKGDKGRLDSQSILLLAVQGLFGIANALSGTFIGVYLWKASRSLALIGWFNFTQYAVSGLIFWIAGKWVKEHNGMNSLRLGVALSGVFYCTVLLLGSSAISYAIAIAVLNGIALGLFWLSFNVVYFEITEPDNRDRFNGWAGLLGSGAGIFAPWISGMLIARNEGERGYAIIFTVSAVIFVIAVILSFWLKKRQTGGDYDWFHGFRQLRKAGSPWRRVVPGIAAQGVREGVFMFFIGLLIYMATGNEQKIGNFSLVTSLVALVSFWLIGKYLTPGRRRIAMLAGSLALAAVIIPLFWPLRFMTLLLFGIGTSLFIPLYIIPMTSAVFDLIGHDKESAERREEFIVLREIALTGGRIIGISAYLLVLPFVTTYPQTVPWLMLAVGSSPIIGWLFMRHYVSEGNPSR
ncbi:MFS transporter [Paenibacillus oenotherae]|uniref:MFS transporter n=1 Tax=Paenibacillus oenotherae TaxID=1435645 RepID=A0ABS7D3M4_9BACL|nr:MFS transporter [Paenibacillus oenotherae]